MSSKKLNSSLPKTFVVFIFLSLLFWFLTKLSKVYQDTIQIDVSYENLPNDKVLKNQLPDFIDMNVEASGFKLFYANIISPKVSVDLSQIEQTSDKDYWLDLDIQKSKVQNQLSNLITINYFEVSRIKVEFDQLDSKYLKIDPDVSISFKDNFDAYGSVKTIPDSIKVSGRKSILDTLFELKTEFIELIDVDKDIDQMLKIHPMYRNKGIVFDDLSVGYEMQVVKFTEASLEIPFVIKNQPNNQNINTFPNTVKINFKIGLKDYEKINKNLFIVECDFEESLDNDLDFLIPKVISYPNFVKDLHLKTQKIDFFITK